MKFIREVSYREFEHLVTKGTKRKITNAKKRQQKEIDKYPLLPELIEEKDDSTIEAEVRKSIANQLQDYKDHRDQKAKEWRAVRKRFYTEFTPKQRKVIYQCYTTPGRAKDLERFLNCDVKRYIAVIASLKILNRWCCIAEMPWGIGDWKKEMRSEKIRMEMLDKP